MRTTSILFASLALAACGDNLEGPGGDDAPPAEVGRTLTGSHVVRYQAFDQTVLDEFPVDLWETLFEAHVATADGWRVIPGLGHRDGSFEITGLPDGPVWLRVATRPFGEAFYLTDAEHVDFDEPVLGPEDPPRGEDGDRLLVEVDGLAPWADTDQLSWFVPDDIVYSQQLISDAMPAPGATEVTGASIDWTGRVVAEVNAGEPAFLVQYKVQALGDGVDVIAPVRAAHPALQQVPGVDNTLTATLTEPPVLPYRLAWDRDAFEAERTAIHPTLAGPSYYHSFAMSVLPGLVDGEVWVGLEFPFLNVVDQAVLEGTTPLDLGELAIPNPYPREWIADSYVVAFPVDLPMPDGTPVQLEAAIGTRTLELADAPARPAITPIRAPTIGGRDAYGDVNGVGLQPEIAWQAPATGTATAYQLRIIEAVANPPFPFRPGWYVAAELWVPGDVTSLQVPVDVLTAGSTYAIMARAYAQPGQDITTRPFRTSGTAAFADSITGRFTP